MKRSALLTQEDKDCPQCGRRMIPWFTGVVLTSIPAQRPWRWRCGCGHQEEGGVVREHTENEIFLEQWEKAQKGDSDVKET